MKNFTPYFKHTLFLLFTLLFAFSSQGQAPTIEWQNTIGGSSVDELQSINQTSDGGYILGGRSFSGLSGDKTEASQGGWDYWVVKLSSLGVIEWQNTIGGSSYDRLYSVNQTSDGGYILGGRSESGISGDKTEASQGTEDYWVVKLSSLGVIEWQNTIGGSGDDRLYSVNQTSDGGYILGGYSASGISGDKTEASQGAYDYWVVKLSSLGVIEWQNTIGGSGNDFLYSVNQTSDGGYILGGYSYSGLSGDKTEASQGTIDYWVVKLNSLGVIEWQNTIGGSGDDYLLSINQTSDGGYILGGYSGSGLSGDKTEVAIGASSDYWVVKLNSLGVIEWQNTIGGSSNEILYSVNQTSDGGYILGGYSYSGISGDKTEASRGVNDYWVVKLNSSGLIQWDKTIGGSSGERLFSIQETGEGGIILGGESASNISGDKTENSQGGNDYWVVKLEAPIFTWTGLTSSSWSDATNWSSGIVPTATNQIVIPDVSGASGNFPVTATDITIEDLTVDAGASLTVGAGNGLIIGANGTVTNNGTVTLEADATGTAWLDDFTNASTTYSGDITVQQYVTAGSGLGQRMFGSPVNNGIVQGLDQTYASASNGQQTLMTDCASAQVTATSPYSNLFQWEETASLPNGCEYEAWFTKDQNTALENGIGYSGWMNDGSTFSFTGTPNTGDIAVSLSGNSNNTGNLNKDGWHVLANPFPSNYQFSPGSAAALNAQTYNPNQAFGGTFQPIVPSDIIGIGQGYVVFFPIGVPPGTSILQNSNRVAGDNESFKSNNDWFESKLDIEVSGNGFKDVSYLYFNNEATQGLEGYWDCIKRPSNLGQPTLYTIIGTEKVSLNGQAYSELGENTIPLGLAPGANGNFAFEATGLNTFPASTIIYLEDKATGTWTNLREQATYTFNMTETEAEDRFEVHFTKPIALTHQAETCEGEDGSVSVDFGNQSIAGNLIEWNYEVVLNSQTLASSTEADMLELADLEPGDYEITFTNGNLQVTEWITIEDKVQVEAEFTPSATQLFTGEELVLTNASLGATDYTWAINNEMFNSMDLNYTFDVPGTYVVLLTSSNTDCEASYEETIIVNEKTTGIAEQIELDKVNVYTQGNTIVVDLTSVKLDGKTDLAIYDMIGQLIIQKMDANSIEYIDMESEAKGIYFVNIIKQGEQVSKKVILK